MAQNNVDPEQVIQALGSEIGALRVENTMLRLALNAANTEIAEHTIAARTAAPDGA